MAEIPVDRLWLAAKSVEPVMIEIGGDEVGVAFGQKAIGAVVEALAIDVHVVGVEHAMHKTRAHPVGGQMGRQLTNPPEKSRRRISLALQVRLIGLDHMLDQTQDQVRPIVKGVTLEGAEADGGMGPAHQNRAPRRRRLVMAAQGFAGFNNRQGLGRVDALGAQHSRREGLAHGALQGKTSVARAAERGLAGTLGGKIDQSVARRLAQLREQKAAPIAQLGIVAAKLMPVIAQGQRFGQSARQGFEPGKMAAPTRLVQTAQAQPLRQGLVAEPNHRPGKIRGRHGVVEIWPQFQDGTVRAVGVAHLMHVVSRTPINKAVGVNVRACNLRRPWCVFLLERPCLLPARV